MECIDAESLYLLCMFIPYCYEKCKQMYDYVLFSYILDYSCFPFLLPTSTLVFRYFNLEVIALTSSFGIFSDVASPAIIL